MTKWLKLLESVSRPIKYPTILANVNSRSRLLYAIARLSVCLSVTFVHPTQPVEIFNNFSSLFGIMAIH